MVRVSAWVKGGARFRARVEHRVRVSVRARVKEGLGLWLGLV
jgi:hypothetical protein